MSSLLHYNPVSRCGTILEKTSFFVVMEKAALFDESTSLKGELKKSVSVQNIALFC
jgi:hypothetical protein